jgi:hypothetical protein
VINNRKTRAYPILQSYVTGKLDRFHKAQEQRQELGGDERLHLLNALFLVRACAAFLLQEPQPVHHFEDVVAAATLAAADPVDSNSHDGSGGSKRVAAAGAAAPGRLTLSSASSMFLKALLDTLIDGRLEPATCYLFAEVLKTVLTLISSEVHGRPAIFLELLLTCSGTFRARELTVRLLSLCLSTPPSPLPLPPLTFDSAAATSPSAQTFPSAAASSASTPASTAASSAAASVPPSSSASTIPRSSSSWLSYWFPPPQPPLQSAFARRHRSVSVDRS